MSISRASLRLPSMMLWLTVLWVALWGSVTVANVLGGVAVATGVVVFARLDSASLRPTYFRPHWALYYIGVLAWQLFVSNIRLAWEILTPGDGTCTAILAIRIRGGSNAVVNLVSNSITLTPGTMTLDVQRNDLTGADVRDGDEGADDEGSDNTVVSQVTLYVHSMYAADVEAVRHDVLRLEELALRAFGSKADYERAQLDVIEHEPLLASPAPTPASTRRDRKKLK